MLQHILAFHLFELVLDAFDFVARKGEFGIEKILVICLILQFEPKLFDFFNCNVVLFV